MLQSRSDRTLQSHLDQATEAVSQAVRRHETTERNIEQRIRIGLGKINALRTQIDNYLFMLSPDYPEKLQEALQTQREKVKILRKEILKQKASRGSHVISTSNHEKIEELKAQLAHVIKKSNDQHERLDQMSREISQKETKVLQLKGCIQQLQQGLASQPCDSDYYEALLDRQYSIKKINQAQNNTFSRNYLQLLKGLEKLTQNIGTLRDEHENQQIRLTQLRVDISARMGVLTSPDSTKVIALQRIFEPRFIKTNQKRNIHMRNPSIRQPDSFPSFLDFNAGRNKSLATGSEKSEL